MDKNKLKRLKEQVAAAHVADEAFGDTIEAKALDARMEFARNLNELLKWKKISQAEFCRQIGMKPTQFSRIVQADENVTITTATRIADGFGVHISRLYQKPRKRKATAEVE